MLVDCDIALVIALDSALPTAKTLICVWRINEAVMGNIRQIVPTEARTAADFENRELGEGEIGSEIERIYPL